MHLNINEVKDAKLVEKIKEEARRRDRSAAFIVRDKLLKAFGLNGKEKD